MVHGGVVRQGLVASLALRPARLGGDRGCSLTPARSLRCARQVRERLDQAQAEVAPRERELSVIVRSVQELLFRTDRNGVLTFVNARWIGGHRRRGGSRARPPPARSWCVTASRGDIVRCSCSTTTAGVRTAHAVMEGALARSRRFDFAVVPLMHHDRRAGRLCRQRRRRDRPP
jgi:hypothetical protein